MSKPLTHQQKRWNRHWNYQLEADPMALAIWKAAKGRLTVKEALKCSDAARKALLEEAERLAAAAYFQILHRLAKSLEAQARTTPYTAA
tara:strand:- start:52 stop:318 length:267 start_codon:yes stop_codon:yes gene_type:complete